MDTFLLRVNRVASIPFCSVFHSTTFFALALLNFTAIAFRILQMFQSTINIFTSISFLSCAHGFQQNPYSTLRFVLYSKRKLRLEKPLSVASD